jgi:hypothetical protein
MPGTAQHVPNQATNETEKTVSLVSFEHCLFVLLKAEEIRWNHVLAAYKEDDNLAQVTQSNPGNIILRYIILVAF